MADARPSSAPMFDAAYFDAPEGGPLTARVRGANQFLGHSAAHRDGQSTLGPNGNRVQAGQLPRTSSTRAGKPDAANPLGRGSSESLNG